MVMSEKSVPEKLGDVVIPRVGQSFIYQSCNGGQPVLNGQKVIVFAVKRNNLYPHGFAIGVEFPDKARVFVRINECQPFK